MEPTVLIDELHITVRVLADLPDAATEAVRKTLWGTEMIDRLRRAVQSALREYPELAAVRVSLSR